MNAANKTELYTYSLFMIFTNYTDCRLPTIPTGANMFKFEMSVHSRFSDWQVVMSFHTL